MSARILPISRVARVRSLACLSAIFGVAAALVAQEPVSEQASDEREVDRSLARARVLDVAHALAVAEGGTRRSGLWEGWLGPEGVSVIPLQLFRGHAYHLVIANGSSSGVPRVDLFDGLGKPVRDVESRGAEGRMILSLAPPSSGTYYLRLRSETGQAGTAIALTYVYR